MINTIHNVFLAHGPHGLGHECFVRILDNSNQFPSSEFPECMFNLGKYQLDWIQLRTIAPVVYVPDAQLPHGLLALVRDMAAELIHEESQLGTLVPLGQLPDVHLELRNVHGLRKNPEMFQAIFPGNFSE